MTCAIVEGAKKQNRVRTRTGMYKAGNRRCDERPATGALDEERPGIIPDLTKKA